MIKTTYANLYQQVGKNMSLGAHNWKIVHKATIRSDWTKKDWEDLDNSFDDVYIKTNVIATPVDYIANGFSNKTFNQVKNWKKI